MHAQRGTLLTDNDPGHRGPRMEVIPKKAAGRYVTISRVAFGTQVQQIEADKIRFGHLHSEENFAGISAGEKLPVGDGREFLLKCKYLSTPIQDITLLLDQSGMQVWRVKTESGSVYELHVIK